MMVGDTQQFVFQSSLEGNPEWNVEGDKITRTLAFQSSLEGNPEWNRSTPPKSCLRRFNPHSRETPSGTTKRIRAQKPDKVSILTRGKPRVEPEKKSPLCWAITSVSILTRGKPRVEPKG